jgi:RNA polymerase primary sigma factor
MSEVDTLKIFFKDVGRTKLLTRDEEVSLAKLIETGDNKARDRMIQANIRLAISIAKKYQNKGCSLEDLIQEANIGLMKAVDRFDWRRGFKFSTYGCWWIKQSVMRHLATHSSQIRLPSHAKGMLWKMKRVAAEYEDAFGQPPSQVELADLLGVTPETMKAITIAASTPLSIDDKIKYSGGSGGPSEGRSLADVIPDNNASHPGDRLDKEKIVEVIQKSLHMLSEREEKIIRLRFGISDDVTNHSSLPITRRELKNIKNKAIMV